MFLKDYIQNTDDTVNKTATLQDVINKMTTNNLHHIVIIENKKPIGIITERDFVKYFSKNIDFKSPAIDHAVKDIIALHHTRLVEYSLSMMLLNDIRKIIVIDNEDEYVGCIEQEDLLFSIEDDIQKKDIKLSSLINTSNEAVLIDENSTLQYTLNMMAIKKLTSFLVTSNKEVLGIISESDIIKLAQSNENQNKMVKQFMHSPIIMIDENKTANDMLHLMQEYTIRRVVVHREEDNLNYILTSKDLAMNVKGNYVNLLELRLFDSRDTFNALSEYVVELIDLGSEQIIFWANSITKKNFNVHLDDTVTKLIPKNIWESLFEELKKNSIVSETIEIKNKFYQIKGHYGTRVDENVIKIFLSDITEVMTLTKKLKKEIDLNSKLLQEQAKMAGMGEMLGNIAHQWRQPLSVISTIASSTDVNNDFDMLEKEEVTNSMNEINLNVQHLSTTIDDFRNFYKTDKRTKDFSIKNAIDKTFKLSVSQFKTVGITIVQEVEDLVINGLENELIQVFMNIINNARDELITQDNLRLLLIDASLKDNNLEINITDNAGGISEDILSEIFKAQFTTKAETNGTGIGLYMSKIIIEEHMKGTITAQNVEFLYGNISYRGAKFSILLPLFLKT